MYTAIPVFICGYFFTVLWVLICNKKTCSQRKQYIKAWPSGKTFNNHIVAFESVVYWHHMWRLVTFRNPWLVYPKVTQKLMEKHHG